MGRWEETYPHLKHKEIWLDEVRCEMILFEKMQERGRRIKDNNLFRSEGGLFYRSLDSKTNTGKTPEMEEFVKFWGDIWGVKGRQTSNHGWRR